MRAIVVRCPQCGATLDVKGEVTSITCSYCETTSRIQPRTRVFQVPVQLPRPQPHVVQMPVAVQKFSWVALLPIFILLAVIGTGVIFGVTGLRRSLGGGSKLFWAGDVPVLRDVDGDGVGDPIGLVRYIMADDRAHLAAYSGKTGARLWESESLGNYSKLGQRMLAEAGDLVLMATDTGTLVARDAKTGKVRWEKTFGEKIEELCAGPSPTELVVLTADEKWHVLDTAGKQRDATPLVRLDRARGDDGAGLFFEAAAERDPVLCESISNRTWSKPVGLLAFEPTFIRDTYKLEIPNLRIANLLRYPGGPIVVVGTKQPGTSILQVAALDPSLAVRWKLDVPAVEPLVSRADDKHVTLSSTAILALYQPKDPAKPRVTSIEIASGKRLWDVELPVQSSFTPTGLRVTGDVVLVATWTGLWGLALADGSVRYVVGDR